MKKPIIGITMGDPAGNGSEISVKALSRSEIYEQCRPQLSELQWEILQETVLRFQ